MATFGTPASTYATSSTPGLTHDVAAGANLVLISLMAQTADKSSALTVNGSAATLIVQNSTSAPSLSVWGYTPSATGSITIASTMDGAARWVMWAVDVDGVTGYDAAASTRAVSSAPSVAISTIAGVTVFGAGAVAMGSTSSPCATAISSANGMTMLGAVRLLGTSGTNGLFTAIGYKVLSCAAETVGFVLSSAGTTGTGCAAVALVDMVYTPGGFVSWWY